MNLKKRMLALMLSVAMVLTYMPAVAFAEASADGSNTTAAEETQAENLSPEAAAAKEEMEQKAAELEEAKQALKDAQDEQEQAQAAYDEYIEKNPDAVSQREAALDKVNEADSNLKEAEQALEDADAAVKAAEQNVAEKQAAVNEAQKAYDASEATWNEKNSARNAAIDAVEAAQKAFDAAVEENKNHPDVKSAHAEVEKAKDDVAAAEAEHDNKIQAVVAASGELEKAKADKAAADQAVTDAKAAEKKSETALTAANEAVEAAQTAKGEADKKVEKAQQDYDAASQAVDEAQNAVDAAAKEVNNQQGLLNTANGNKISAAADLASANAVLTTAKVKKAFADNELAEYQEEMDSKLNANEFFKWLSEQTDQSQKVRDGAAVASRMLTNTMTSADNSASIHNDGTVSSGSGAKKYAEIISYTHIGEEGDATEWGNFRHALEMIEKGNSYRAKENLSPLNVSSVMMAMGEINANYQKSLGGISISHSSAFLALENLASSGVWDMSKPTGKNHDPYDGWYNKEKKVFDYLEARGLDTNTNNLTSDQKKEVQTALSLKSINDVQTGHYRTLTDRQGAMTSSGFGYVSSYAEEDGGYWLYQKYSQMFGYSRSKGPGWRISLCIQCAGRYI